MFIVDLHIKYPIMKTMGCLHIWGEFLSVRCVIANSKSYLGNISGYILI